MVEVFFQHQFLLKLPFRHFSLFRTVIIPRKIPASFTSGNGRSDPTQTAFWSKLVGCPFVRLFTFDWTWMITCKVYWNRNITRWPSSCPSIIFWNSFSVDETTFNPAWTKNANSTEGKCSRYRWFHHQVIIFSYHVTVNNLSRLLPMSRTKKADVEIDLHPCPGKTVNGVKRYIEGNLRRDPNIPLCILHVGTNDCSTRDRSRKTQGLCTSKL